MTKIMKILLTFLWLAAGLVSLAVAAPRSKLDELVPKIVQKHYELYPDGDKYNLRVELFDGNKREEIAELHQLHTNTDTSKDKYSNSDALEPVELSVKGTIEQNYPKHQLIIIYEANKDGYRARVHFVEIKIQTVLHLSAIALKDITG